MRAPVPHIVRPARNVGETITRLDRAISSFVSGVAGARRNTLLRILNERKK